LPLEKRLAWGQQHQQHQQEEQQQNGADRKCWLRKQKRIEQNIKYGVNAAHDPAIVTTLMIRNLPTQLTQAELLAKMNSTGLAGSYDFCYLPRSFESKENKGYAFVNFVTPDGAREFALTWHRSVIFGVAHPLNVSAAAMQGLAENRERWETGSRMRRIRNPNFQPFVAGLNDGTTCAPRLFTLSRCGPRLHHFQRRGYHSAGSLNVRLTGLSPASSGSNSLW